MKRIYFFATPADIVPVLKRFEQNEPLKFVDIYDWTTPNRDIYLESSAIPDMGIATHETGNASQAYMVSQRNVKNHLRPFKTNKGEKRWALYECDNEEAVILNMAGIWKTGTLLPGNMVTMHETLVAQQLMKWFLSALKAEEFTKVKSWWLGKEALAMLKAGKRLSTTAEQSPPEFDLKLPEQA